MRVDGAFCEDGYETCIDYINTCRVQPYEEQHKLFRPLQGQLMCRMKKCTIVIGRRRQFTARAGPGSTELSEKLRKFD